MPGDPQINEGGCVYMLQQDINFETLPYHQNAALQVIMDLWDRKVTREEFGRSAGHAITFYATLAKLYTIQQTATMFAGGTLNADIIETSRTKLHEIAHERRGHLIKVMNLLMECPTSEDRVN